MLGHGLAFKKRIIMLLMLAAAYLYFSFLTTQTRLGSFFAVDIPIIAKFPIPLLFWLGVFLYLAAAAKILGCEFKKTIRFSVLLGFFTHYIFLLVDLNMRNSRGDIGWASGIYALYFKLMLAAVVAILSVWSGILIKNYFLKKTIDANSVLTFTIPLLYIYSFIAFIVSSGYILVFIMIALFLLSFYLEEGAYQKIKKFSGRFLDFIFDEKVFLLLIFLAAMAFRLVFLKRVMSEGNYWRTSSDGVFMDNNARIFLSGQPIGAPQSKAYWLFLAGVYTLFGRNYFIVCFIQSFLGSLAVAMTYLIAKRGFGLFTARIAAVIAVMDYPLIFSACGLGHQAMDIFYGVFAVYLILKYKELGMSLKGTLILILAGLTSGVAMANREVNVLLPVVLAGWLIFVFLRARYKKIKIALSIALFLISTAIGVAPFLYLNYRDSGSLYEQRSSYGAKRVLIKYNPRLGEIGFNPLEDPKGSVKVVIQHPVVFIKAAWSNYYTKFADLYLNQDYGGFDPIFLVRKPVTKYYISMWFYAYVVVLFGFIRGFLDKAKNNKAVIYLIFLMIAYKTLFHLLTISVYRYRAAIDPFLIIFAAYGICAFIRFSQSKQPER